MKFRNASDVLHPTVIRFEQGRSLYSHSIVLHRPIALILG